MRMFSFTVQQQWHYRITMKIILHYEFDCLICILIFLASIVFALTCGCLYYLLQFLLDVAALRFLRLAKDQHGCCIIQKCIEHSNDEQKYNLLCKITSSALSLSEDQYGYGIIFAFHLIGILSVLSNITVMFFNNI